MENNTSKSSFVPNSDNSILLPSRELKVIVKLLKDIKEQNLNTYRDFLDSVISTYGDDSVECNVALSYAITLSLYFEEGDENESTEEKTEKSLPPINVKADDPIKRIGDEIDILRNSISNTTTRRRYDKGE